MCSDMVQLLLLIMAVHCKITRSAQLPRRKIGLSADAGMDSVQETIINNNIASVLIEWRFYWMLVGAVSLIIATVG